MFYSFPFSPPFLSLVFISSSFEPINLNLDFHHPYSPPFGVSVVVPIRYSLPTTRHRILSPRSPSQETASVPCPPPTRAEHIFSDSGSPVSALLKSRDILGAD